MDRRRDNLRRKPRRALNLGKTIRPSGPAKLNPFAAAMMNPQYQLRMMQMMQMNPQARMLQQQQMMAQQRLDPRNMMNASSMGNFSAESAARQDLTSQRVQLQSRIQQLSSQSQRSEKDVEEVNRLMRQEQELKDKLETLNPVLHGGDRLGVVQAGIRAQENAIKEQMNKMALQKIENEIEQKKIELDYDLTNHTKMREIERLQVDHEYHKRRVDKLAEMHKRDTEIVQLESEIAELHNMGPSYLNHRAREAGYYAGRRKLAEKVLSMTEQQLNDITAAGGDRVKIDAEIDGLNTLYGRYAIGDSLLDAVEASHSGKRVEQETLIRQLDEQKAKLEEENRILKEEVEMLNGLSGGLDSP